MLLVIFSSRLSAKLEPETRTQVTGLGVLYQILSAVLTVFWIFDYLPPASQPLALAIAAGAIYLGNLLGAGLLRFLFASFGAVALVTFLFLLRNLQPAGVQSLIAILLLALPFEWARRKGADENIPDEPIRSLCLAAIALSGWGWVSSGYWHGSGFALVTAWTLYATALLALGVFIRERVYQFAGFGVLVASLVHVALFDLWAHETPALLPAALALAAVALTYSVPHVKLPMFPALGPIWLIAAVAAWLIRHGGLRLRDALLHQSPWWSAVVVISSALIIGHWWKANGVGKIDLVPARDSLTARLIAAVGGVLILCAWVRPFCSVEVWQLVAPLLALGVVAGALLLRDGVLAATAQLPILAGCVIYALERSLGLFPSGLFAIFPALSPLLVALCGPRLATKFAVDENVPLPRIGIIYEIASVLLSGLWIFDYLPRAWQPFALVVVGVAYFALNRVGLGVHGIVYLILGVTAVLTFWVSTWNGERGGLQNLLTIVLLGLPFEWARRTNDNRDLPEGLNRSICLGAIAVTGWRWVSTGNWQESGFYLAAAWAVYAAVILGVGLAVRERVYRLAGFGILAATIIRVTIFDAWRLGVAYRMISFIVLGAVLMIVGFLYNRYQDKLKEWL